MICKKLDVWLEFFSFGFLEQGTIWTPSSLYGVLVVTHPEFKSGGKVAIKFKSGGGSGNI